ncbi:hypothetical protein G153_08164 [Megasphaera sp. BL7]|uniref:hypothetical protein n=1 Tax=unclassified Megasphaera TaxID=2626256 RepID=UPI00035766AB|nr:MULTISPECIES: hypothetical protein [unclassified Megasphaera]EPP15851.1 hypothetical protein G153_08164 [Megasphaera sp. BL7]EPP18948.1 hypothetical protein NM10_01149 [Megasphaera sp. NM10]
MEIKIDMNGSDVELVAFLHSLTINHSQKEETGVKTANTKKKGRPKKAVKVDPEPAPSDDILDDPEMADIGAHIFGEDNRNE